MTEPTEDGRAGTVVVLRGVPASPGIGFGPAVLVGSDIPEPPTRSYAGGADAEVARAVEALDAVAVDLTDRGRRAGGDAQAVLEAQALMAGDPDLGAEIARLIRDGMWAARAVFEGFGAYRAALADAGDYLAARVADLDDVRDRVVARLLGLPMPGVPELIDPSVLVARDLAPADTALLDPSLVVGFVTEEGGPTSHTAIIARAMGVPAVVACRGVAAVQAGTPLLVDGTAGTVTAGADGETVRAAGEIADRRAGAIASAGGPGATADRHPVAMLANVGGSGDAAAAMAAGAEGVGLFRTEFAFLGRESPPTMEEQERLYHDVLAACTDRKVIARVLDAGADKPLAFLNTVDEPNPALGLRGLRLLLATPDILRAQLRALIGASTTSGAVLELMAPMVADAQDARAFVTACREAGFAGRVGVMVEIPAAALRAAEILEYADFLSIGTNDLAQYAFAADRQVGGLARYQDPWQPALLDLVASAAAAALAAGKPCGVCGEAASDPGLACVLVGLGVTSLSMGAGALPYVRAGVAAHSRAQCQAAAVAARAASSADAARIAARAALPGLPDLGL